MDMNAIETRMKAAMAAGKGPVKIESLWILDDGRTGNLNRCKGIAQALGFPAPEIIEIKDKFGTRWLDWLPVPWWIDRLPKKPFPQVVLAAGARGSRVLRWMKAQVPQTFTVQIMRPASNVKNFDVVVMETHDNPPKRHNVCVTTGAVNHITREMLEKEGTRWESRLKHCGNPCLAVLVGGGSKHGSFGVNEAKRLADELLAAAREGGMSLLVTTSRRTGKEATDALEKALTNQKKTAVNFWRPDNPTTRDNPYMAYLALAKAVVVTGDSISMVSEAASAGKPVYVWVGNTKLPRKFKTFLETMSAQGRARIWDGTGTKLNLRPPAAPLMDTIMAAGFIRARLRKG